ncbi:MAG: dihydrolipoyl dehydrogenase [Candidatus Hydrogenedentota bacterium]
MSDGNKGNGNSGKTRVAIIGGGPGGYAAAFKAADMGLAVTLIDLNPNPGGVCLYRGCIPSKTLLHVAKILTEARDAEHWGIKFSKPRMDLGKLRESKDAVVEKLTGGLGQLGKARNITYLQGRAYFEESKRIRITDDAGKETFIDTDYTIIAAGSRPARLPNVLIESERLMDSTNALDIPEIPKTLLVVGGGYIGLELGSVYAALGSKVTVVEMAPQLLPGGDADLVRILHEQIDGRMESILLSTKVADLKETKDGIQVTLQSEGAKPRTKVFEKVLVSVGRRPNSSGLGLANTTVEVDEKGFIKVDEQRRTTDASVFAIGDVCGEPMLAHKASHEGRVAAEVIAGTNVAFEPSAIPAVVFTDPELAWCGVTESEAKKKGLPIKVSRFPWGASGRATTLNRSDGLTKLITDAQTGQLLGMGVVGPGAGELIAEGVLAIEMGATATDIGLSIHPHPTLSETVMETADMIFGHATHIYRPGKS